MEASQPQPFVVNGKEYPVPDDFTLGEMCDAERFFGVEFGADTISSMRLVAATLYIAIRRVDPSVTVEDIRALPPEALKQADEVKAGTPKVPPSDESTDEPNEPSGEGSPNGGVDLDSLPAATGAPS